jgi:hypothetical protein
MMMMTGSAGPDPPPPPLGVVTLAGGLDWADVFGTASNASTV